MKKIVFAIVALITLGNTINAQSKSTVVMNLSPERFKAITTNDKAGVLIDLRTNEEIDKTGRITGAVQLDFLAKDAEKQIDKLDKNKTYYIYCASGGRSSDAADYMEKSGFKKIYTLEKGMTGWLNKGFPVEKK